MALSSGSMQPRRLSLAWVMAVILFIAADLAALRAILPRLPNPGLVIMILVLEVGLFRMVSRRGAARAFWLGFQVAGWAYVITAEVFAWTAWRLARSLFEGWILMRPLGPPFEMQRFILFAGGLQLLVSLAVALIAGILTRLAWNRWVQPASPVRATTQSASGTRSDTTEPTRPVSRLVSMLSTALGEAR